MGIANTRKLIVIWASLIGLAIFLVSCGDSTVAPTPVANVQATIAATAVPATAVANVQATIAATAVPATAVTATSPAKIEDVSTAAATINISATIAAVPVPTRTVSNISAAPAKAAIADLPAIKNAKVISIDQASIDNLVKQLGIPGAATQLYVSSDPAAGFSTNIDAALTGAGWHFKMTGATKPQAQSNGDILATYNKTGQPDLLFQIKTLPTDQATLNQSSLPGLSAADMKKVSTQLKGQKTLMIVIIAPNIAK